MPKLLQFEVLTSCRWHYWSIFIRLAVVASEICEILKNSRKIQTYRVQGHPRSSNLVVNRKRMQLPISLLVINSNFGRISHSFRDYTKTHITWHSSQVSDYSTRQKTSYCRCFALSTKTGDYGGLDCQSSRYFEHGGTIVSITDNYKVQPVKCGLATALIDMRSSPLLAYLNVALLLCCVHASSEHCFERSVQVRDQEYDAAKTRYEERRRLRERCRWLRSKIGVRRSRDHGRRSVHASRSVALSFSVTSRNSTIVHCHER